MIPAAISLSIIILGVVILIAVAEHFVKIQNQKAIEIEKLHPASYRKVINRFKQIKEDFLSRKYLYEKKEISIINTEKKKNRRPHVSSRYKEDESTDFKEDAVVFSPTIDNLKLQKKKNKNKKVTKK